MAEGRYEEVEVIEELVKEILEKMSKNKNEVVGLKFGLFPHWVIEHIKYELKKKGLEHLENKIISELIKKAQQL